MTALGHLDVRGLQIAMNDTPLVRRLEGDGHLQSQAKHIVERQRTRGQPIGQREAVDELEHEHRRLVRMLDAVNRRNAWMIEGREQLRLAFEPCDA